MNAGATVALTLGPAMITGLVAYGAARLQSQTSVRLTSAESERLLMQHAESERQHRQASYHAFLTLMYRLDQLVAGFAAQPLTDEAIDQWLAEFQTLYGGIELVSPDAVRRAILGVKDTVDQIGRGAGRRGGRVEFCRSFADAYQAQRKALVGAVDTAVEAMRADVAL